MKQKTDEDLRKIKEEEDKLRFYEEEQKKSFGTMILKDSEKKFKIITLSIPEGTKNYK